MGAESHVYVILTCDRCGTVEDYEDYDATTIQLSEEDFIKEARWSYNDDQELLCPDCAESLEEEED